MAHLYVNQDGFPVTTHSYSGGQEFSYCRRKYRLSRVDGWKERSMVLEQKASLKFGDAVEAAIQFYHNNGLVAGEAVAKFRNLWERVGLLSSGMTYTKKEGSWEDLRDMGVKMMAEYEEKLPGLPFDPAPKFQLNFKKEVFPGTDLAGIFYTAYIDMLHSAAPLVVDIKTGAMAMDETPGLLQLDQQLREYAWVTGVPNVAFLWFVKGKKPHMQFVQATISPEDINEAGETIGQEIAEIVAATKRGSFPKQPGIRFPNNKCINCAMLGICIGNDEMRDDLLVNVRKMDNKIGEGGGPQGEPVRGPAAASDSGNASPQADWLDTLED